MPDKLSELLTPELLGMMQEGINMFYADVIGKWMDPNYMRGIEPEYRQKAKLEWMENKRKADEIISELRAIQKEARHA